MRTCRTSAFRMTRRIAPAGLALSLMLGLAADTRGAEAAILDIRAVGPRTESVAPEAYRRILYVSPTAGSDETGAGTRERPWRTLSFALGRIEDAAESVRVALFCAAGTCDSETLVMKPYVDLFGGFHPQTWERDIFANPSVLDGRGVRRVVLGANNARLDGFVVTRGVARYHGGGILCDDTSPLISNNVIVENLVLEPDNFDPQRIHQSGHCGGGIASLYNAAPVIRNNLLLGNRTSVGNGAGVAFYGWLRAPGVETTIRDNRITGGRQPVLENNLIIGNQAGVNDIHRTRSSNGGGISCSHEARPTVRNNLVAGNQALGRGDAGGIYIEYYSDPWIVGNWILGNSCEDDGGGVYTMRLGQPLLEQNFVAGNWSSGGGVGGIRLSKEGRGRLVGNRIVQNQSGGGVTSDDSYMEMEGNVVMHNLGGPALTYDMNFTYMMPSRILNNILRDNEKGAIRFLANAGPPPIVEGNNIEGGYAGRGNFDRQPGIAADGVSGTATSAEFDRARGVTLLVAAQPLESKAGLEGRVIRLDRRWGLVKEVRGNRIAVWGDLSGGTSRNGRFEIIAGYR